MALNMRRMGWANEVALYCIRGVRATPQFHVSLSRVGKPTGPRDAMLARGAPAHLRPRPRTSTVARTLRPARASARARGCQAVRAVIPGTTMAPRAPASPAAEPVGGAPTRALVTGRDRKS